MSRACGILVKPGMREATALEIPVATAATSNDGPKRHYLARLPSMYGAAFADKG